MRKLNPISLLGFAVALTLLLVTCRPTMGQTVRSNYLPGTNFAQYHTYKWVTTTDGLDQIVDAQIKQAVDSQLAVKGLVKTDSDKADLEIGYHIGLDQEKEWNAFGSRGLLWGGGIGSATSSATINGSLLLAIYDSASKELVWTGIATKTLNPSGNQSKTQQNLDKAMQKLLKQFPPREK